MSIFQKANKQHFIGQCSIFGGCIRLLWPPYGIGQAIIFLPCGFFYHVSIFFPCLISAVGDWMSTILPHMMWPSCEFRMHVWNVLHVARWKYRTQKWRKNCHLCTIAQLCRAISLQLRHVSTIGEKLVKQEYLLQMSAHYGKLRPTNGSDQFTSFGHPQQISTGFASWLCYCSDVAHRRPTKLCTMFGHILVCYTIYTFSGALATWQKFARCKIHFSFTSKNYSNATRITLHVGQVLFVLAVLLAVLARFLWVLAGEIVLMWHHPF